MGLEITTHATVGPNGRVEFDLSELQEGQRVELVVRTESAAPKRTRGGYGALKGGLIHMSDDFDAPLEEFADHQRGSCWIRTG